ncbi:hypothetical protein BDR05DRAFT_950953 [Suillus weaverae]|nr:hypothetical protein BDR05DRAFT_950953 [Suillus weaverae]
MLQLKYEAFGRELLVLRKIREEFIQETYNRKSKTEVLQSSIDVLGNDAYDKTVKKGKGHPKGVLNSTAIELQSLPRSPMKLRSKNSAKSSSLSLHDDAISKRPDSEVVEEMRDIIQVSKLQKVQSDISSAFKRVNKEVAPLDHRITSNSPKKNIQTSAENDVPALDLSTLFFRKLL